MADSTITDLPEISALADDDLLVAVDIDAGPATTKKISVQNAIKNNTDVAANTSHRGDVLNPHSVTKGQVGLGNVDNTSDASKPISSATQTALNNKYEASNPSGFLNEASHDSLLADNPHSVTKGQIGLSNVDNLQQIPIAQKGAAEGVATLELGSRLTPSQASTLTEVVDNSTVTDITEAELETLSDKSIADALHSHWSTTVYHFKDKIKTKNAAYSVLASIIALGTDNLPAVSSIAYKAIVSVDGNTGAFRIVEPVSGDIIAEVTGITSTVNEIITFTVNAANLPATEKILDIEALNDGGSNTNITLFQIVRNF